jgi:hypothetical protein
MDQVGRLQRITTSKRNLWAKATGNARVDTLEEESAHADALGLRQTGEEFSVLPTI